MFFFNLILSAFRWKAANYSQFYGMTLDEGIRYRLGTQRPSTIIMNMNEIQVQTDNVSLYLLADAASEYLSFILKCHLKYFILRKSLQNHQFLLVLSQSGDPYTPLNIKWWVPGLWLTPLKTKTFSLKKKLVPIFGKVAPLFINSIYVSFFIFVAIFLSFLGFVSFCGLSH